jgi:PII-like signaling protein
MQGKRVLMRIHITEGDQYEGGALSGKILGLIRERRYAGATIFRGAMSFGSRSRTHSDRVEVLALDLPVIIECVETEENLQKILPEIDRMIGGGLITLEKVNVVAYRHGDAGDASATPPAANE